MSKLWRFIKHFFECLTVFEHGFFRFWRLVSFTLEDPIVYVEMKRLLEGGDIDVLTGIERQGGAGAYTLCERCNSFTGARYGSYVKMVRQGMGILLTIRSASFFHLPFLIHPLRVIKQVVCMFMSTNGAQFQYAQPELARFVLNPEARHLPTGIRIYAFYTVSDRSRSTGPAGMMSGLFTEQVKRYVLSETTFPPFGFVMTFRSAPPDERLTDITYFSEYRYEDRRTLC